MATPKIAPRTTLKITRSTPSQRNLSVNLTIKRVSAALDLIADGVEEITGMGDHDLAGKAALGFANVIHSCADDLAKLTPASAAKKGAAQQ